MSFINYIVIMITVFLTVRYYCKEYDVLNYKPENSKN